MLSMCHVFAHFNNLSASLLRCACIFTTNSTGGIAWPRWITGALTHSPPLTWGLWPTSIHLLQVSKRSYAKPFEFVKFRGFVCFKSVLSMLSSVNWDTVWKANTTDKFQVSTELNRNVGLLRLFPGITTATVSISAKGWCPQVLPVIGITPDTAGRREQSMLKGVAQVFSWILSNR